MSCACATELSGRHSLCAVLLNPNGRDQSRSQRRVELLCELLDIESHRIVNLCQTPTSAARDLGVGGSDPDAWADSRTMLEVGVTSSDVVLFGFGVGVPSSASRTVFQDQVAWLEERTAAIAGTVCQVGGQPRHPSRWQRYTHRHYPDLEFRSALLRSVHVRGCPMSM